MSLKNSLLLRNLPEDFDHKILSSFFGKAGEIIQIFTGRTSMIIMFADESSKEGALMFDDQETEEDSKNRKYLIKIEEVEHFEIEKYDEPLKKPDQIVSDSPPIPTDLASESHRAPKPDFTFKTPKPPEPSASSAYVDLDFPTPRPQEEDMTPIIPMSQQEMFPPFPPGESRPTGAGVADTSNPEDEEVDMRDEFRRRTMEQSEERKSSAEMESRRSGAEVSSPQFSGVSRRGADGLADLRRIEQEISKINLPCYRKDENPMAFLYSYQMVAVTFLAFVLLVSLGVIH